MASALQTCVVSCFQVASFWASTAAADVGEEYYLNSATEMIQENMAWLQQNMPAACGWLASAE